ncbi:LegC family aminotransferase [Cohnella cellulosilytica]|uniref:LegC family aminotransferase n=1 Tax=Cohnella cellulosilytica TaxID=986710 RepID=A0ABW2FMD5_9BACL
MSKQHLAGTIVDMLDRAFPRRGRMLALHEPRFSGNEWDYVKECIDTGWVSSAGAFVDRFERELAEYTGAGYAVSVVNGTAALHMSLLLAGVKEGDEVLIPSLTFVATANAVSYCGAIPHFVDVTETTLGMDGTELERYLYDIVQFDAKGDVRNRVTGNRIKAVVPMHTFGHPVDLEALVELCDKYRLVLIEDAAESLGSIYKGKHTGIFGKIGAISFNGNKIVTTGGGGAIVTNDAELARKAKHLTTTAKLPHRWEFHHDQIGFNYRMPNLNAALGCAQLERLNETIADKRIVTERYKELIQGIEGVRLMEEPEYCRSNYWLNAIILDKPNVKLRDQILVQTNKAGFQTRPIWTPMHRLPMFGHHPRMTLTVTERLEHSVINIPSSQGLMYL